jgi:xylitol oxidase
VKAVQAVVAGAFRVRALGTGHSFNPIADTPGDLISLAALPPLVEVDAERRLARISGSVRYGELAAAVARHGLALQNMGSLPHINVAGSCATGTHGSGLGNTTLAARVRALTVVTATGDLARFDRESSGELFDGVVVSLGRLGIVVELELDLVSGFEVAQTVVEDVPDSSVADRLHEILAAAYSVSVFTTWGNVGVNQVWLKEAVGRDGAWAGSTTWGGRPADGPRNPVPGMPPRNATAQLGAVGPWNERLPHFRMEFTPSSGAELQSEYLLPLEHAAPAWHALSGLRSRIAPVLQVSEVRTVAADQLWLSMAEGTPSVAFHFTWFPDATAVLPVVTAIEEALAPHRARPHWGKVFTTPAPDLERLYPRLPDFRRLVGDHDPQGKFGTALVDGWLGRS